MSERERFEKYCKENGADPESHVGKAVWIGWQAALSTRKPFGFGLVDKDGNGTTFAFTDKYSANKILDQVDVVLVNNPYSIVELFYEDSES